jgi:hypothetical protein
MAYNALRRIDMEQRRYAAALSQIADDWREQVLIPFCRRKGWRFTAGMGTWCFWDRDNAHRFGDDKGIPSGIRSVLEMSIDGDNSFGAVYVQDYKPPSPIEVKGR